ncbi:MAG: prepilin peptidase [Paracoccaceae bacterium]
MESSAAAALWFLPFATPIAIWAALSDLSTMKIPNKTVLSLMAVYLVVGLIALPLPEYGLRMTHFVVVLVIGFLLNMAGMLGAGDAKFAAAMAPFVAVSDLTFILMLLAICILLGFASHRIARRMTPIRKLTPEWESWTEVKQFPMGYPLAATLIAYLFMTAFSS